MHYKASPIPGFQPPDSRGDIKGYYALARSSELVELVRLNSLPGRSHTRGIELRCRIGREHSTGCALALGLVTNLNGEPPNQVEVINVYPKYYVFIKPQAGDTFEAEPAVTTGRFYQSVTIRCMTCGKPQSRKAVYGLLAAKKALENRSLSCTWLT